MSMQFAGPNWPGAAPGMGQFKPTGGGHVPNTTNLQPPPAQQRPAPVSSESGIGMPTMPNYRNFPAPPGWTGPWPIPGGTPLPLPGQPFNPMPVPGTPAGPQQPGTPQTPQAPQTPSLPPTGQTPSPGPQLSQLPPATQTPGGQPGAANNLGSLLSQVPPIHLPTQQSQNQLLAQAQQRANPVQMLNRMGNSGIATDSAVNIQRLLAPSMQTMQQGALGAANLGIDDQLLRDKHLMQGLTGLGMLDNDRSRQLASRQRIGIDANQAVLDAIFQMLGGLGNTFNFGNITGGFGDVAGAF
jgi:hypothetical protein